VDAPSDWDIVDRRQIGPFTTSMTLRKSDGPVVSWTAWHHRKGLGLSDRHDAASRRWWMPDRLGWWIAVLFVVGSTCFAVGAFPPTASLLGDAVGWIFFIGSIFFTSAAYLQYFEATNEGDDVEGNARTRRIVGVRTASIGWWVTAIQLAGTLSFNLSTYNALRDLSTRQEEALVWAPDAVGSICFLVASGLAVAEICHRPVCWSPRLEAWRIAAINMAGSIAFGISAVGAFVVPETGELNNATVANSFTFVGAVLFLIGAVLLIPALTPRSAVAPRPDTTSG
jgi:hypothetical protein